MNAGPFRAILVTLLAAVSGPAALRADTPFPPVVISEIMFNPDGDENAREFVELLNRSDAAVSVEGFRIGDGSAFDLLVPISGGGWTIPARGYGVVFDPDYFTAGEPYNNLAPGVPLFTVPDKAIGMRGLANSSPEPVYLVSARGDTLSKVRYAADCPAGHSWERVRPGGGDGMENFNPSRAKEGTPGGPNSVTPPDRNPVLDEHSLALDPPAPPMGGTADLVVTIRNGGLESFRDARVTVSITPGSVIGTASFDEDIPPGGVSSGRRITVERIPGGRIVFTAAVEPGAGPSYAEDDTARIALDIPVPQGTVVLNEIMAAPKEGPEWIEILGTGASAVSLSGWRIADAAGGRSDPFPDGAFVSPGRFAVIASDRPSAPIPSETPFIRAARFPALNNDGDTVRLLDRSGAPADSTVYEAAAAGVSLELVSPLRRGEAHAWDLSVDPAGCTPGRENSIFFPADGGSSDGGKAALTITPNPFDDTTVIGYVLPFPLARVRLEVYDRSGRKVAVLRDGAESGSRWETTWDGRSGGRRLPAGAYILSLEALNRQDGATVAVRKPIVVARKL